MSEPVEVGFWATRTDSGQWAPATADRPIPVENSSTLSDDARATLVRYLELPAHRRLTFRGWSDCRLCGKANGSQDVMDGQHVWPSGLAHYVRDHKVQISDTFTTFALSRMAQISQGGAGSDLDGLDNPAVTMPRRRTARF